MSFQRTPSPPAHILPGMDRIPEALLRRLAVEAEVDPRTVVRVWKGQPVCGMSSERALRALQAHGIPIKTRQPQRKAGAA